MSERQRREESPQLEHSLESRFPDIYRALKDHASALINEHLYEHQEIEFTFSSAAPEDLHILQIRPLRLVGQEALPAFVRQAMSLYPESRERCRQILDHHTDLWADFARRNGLPLITTEAWTTVFYEDISPNGQSGEWEWFKDIAEIGVRLAIAKGWQGICTSNFCQPHFEGMWSDVAWHQRMTGLIKS